MKKRTIDKAFYKNLWVIVLPIIVQNLLSAAVSSADVIMLNSVSQDSISAVSLATQYTAIVGMLLYGLGTGVTMLSAQYWGKGDKHTVEKVQGIGLKMSIIWGSLVAFCSLVIPQYMMLIYTNDSTLIDLGARYLRIASIGFVFWSISEVYMSTLRSIGRVSSATIISSIALILNIMLNAVFIYGLLGAPKMGVQGVALATTIARTIQFIVCLLISSRSKDIRLNFAAMFGTSRILWKDFLSMAIPAIINDISWGLAYSMYSVIMGHLGSDIVAANAITGVARNFGTVVGFALASATGIILGQMLGRNDFAKAKSAANRLFALSAITGLAGGFLILAASPLILKYADLTPQALDYLKFMLLLHTYYCMGQTVNTTLIVGVFRAGGDSKFGMICDTIDMWLYAVPLGFIAAFVLKLPVKWVYFLLLTDEFVKWPFVFKHYFSYTWAKNITRDNIK